MKKVLFFLESLSGGGAEKVLTDIVRNLDPTKFDVTVCTVTDEGIYQSRVAEKVRYRSVLREQDYRSGFMKRLLYRIRYKMIYTLPTAWVYRWLFREKYDVECAFVEGFATKLMSASSNPVSRKIVWVHTDMERNPYAQNSFRSMEAHREAYRRYDTICCVSESVKAVFQKLILDDERVTVQYNPVDSDEVQRNGLEEIDLVPNSSLQLGTIGRLVEAKGYIRLLDCLGKLRREYPDFSLWIIGEGPQRPELEKQIVRYSLENNVRLLGFHENPYKYMHRCDAFVCSSYAEGFSTAATEALILGKPVFTTECAGMRELFGSEQCGEIVPNTDEALETMLRNMLSGTWKAENYADAALQRGAMFSISRRIQEIEDLLNE